MRLLGIPTAIVKDEDSGVPAIHASVIKGSDKRNIVWEGGNHVFSIPDDRAVDGAVKKYTSLIERVLAEHEAGRDSCAVVHVGRKDDADRRIQRLAVSIAGRVALHFGDRVKVANPTFGDGFGDGIDDEDTAECAAAPYDVQAAYERHLRQLHARMTSEENMDERRRLFDMLHDEESQIGRILLGFETSSVWETLRGAPNVYDAYEPYYMDLLGRANAGDSFAIRTLETEMRHAALRVFTECSRVPQRWKQTVAFYLAMTPDILTQLPFRAGEGMRRIFGLELSRLFGLPGNISVKSRFFDEKSPPFGDLTTVTLANEADAMTGEAPDVVFLRCPKGE